uniref:Uncharacterized protein n=1 Tax=Anguilla anguilla TaxID=7936 RepID=A0A0E9P523_ANGAN
MTVQIDNCMPGHASCRGSRLARCLKVYL